LGDEKRTEEFQERFSSFLDPNIPKFHYGSHYSSPGIIFSWFLRLQPFTDGHISLFSGNQKF
jgi:hypothetical protein